MVNSYYFLLLLINIFITKIKSDEHDVNEITQTHSQEEFQPHVINTTSTESNK